MKMDRTREAGWSLSDLGALVSGALLDAWSQSGEESWADTQPQRRASPRRVSGATAAEPAASAPPAAPVAIWEDVALKPAAEYSVWRKHEMRALESEIDQWRRDRLAAHKPASERGRKACQRVEPAHPRRAR